MATFNFCPNLSLAGICKRADRRVDESPIVLIGVNGNQITVKKTEYVDYDNIYSKNPESIDTFNITPEGILISCSGPRIGKFSPGKAGINIIKYWEDHDLNMFLSIFRSLRRKERAQIIIEHGEQLRICGNFTTNKNGKVDSVLIIIKPEIETFDTLENMIAK